MAQAGYTPIQLYLSTTASAVPTAGNLANGELAINITDGKLYYKDNGGSVQVLATKAGAAGDVVGPGSSTDNALVRFDTTTGKLVQNSVGILDDSGNLTGLAAVTATSFAGALNGTVGATTPNTGAFTTLAASGAVTLSGGTANGVAYLNGSKVLTTGSALTFDGTNFATTGRGNFGQRVQITGNTAPTSGTGLELFYDGTLAGALGFARGTGYIPVGIDGSDVRFYTSSSEGMRLTSGGLVVGSTTALAKLDVKGGTTIANLGDWNSKSNSIFELANPAVRFGIGYDSSDQVLLQAFDSSNNAKLLCLQGYGGNVGIGSNAVPSVGSTVVLGVGGANGGTLAVLQSGNIVYRTSASTSGVDFFNPNSSPMQWYTGGTSRIVLDASGNFVVGGTTALLNNAGRGNITLNGATDAILAFGNGGTNSAYIFSNASTFELNAIGARVMNFTVNGSERARIDTSGNLMVNTTGALGYFTSVTTNGSSAAITASNTSNSYVGDGILTIRSSRNTSNSTYYAIGYWNTATSNYRFIVNDGGAISSTSTSISGLSDIRYKENICSLETGLNEILLLQPRRFDWKEGCGNQSKGVAGFVAQEVELVLPDLVEQWRVRPSSEETHKTIRISDMIPTLVKAIQEQQVIIEQLKADVAALKGA